MASIPLVVVLGVAVILARRISGPRLWHAVLRVLFRFCLSQTAAEPVVGNLVSSLISMLSG